MPSPPPTRAIPTSPSRSAPSPPTARNSSTMPSARCTSRPFQHHRAARHLRHRPPETPRLCLPPPPRPGHSNITEPLGTFATDRQKLLDYAFRSLHVTADASKLLLRAYYGAAPAKSRSEEHTSELQSLRH